MFVQPSSSSSSSSSSANTAFPYLENLSNLGELLIKYKQIAEDPQSSLDEDTARLLKNLAVDSYQMALRNNTERNKLKSNVVSSSSSSSPSHSTPSEEEVLITNTATTATTINTNTTGENNSKLSVDFSDHKSKDKQLNLSKPFIGTFHCDDFNSDPPRKMSKKELMESSTDNFRVLCGRKRSVAYCAIRSINANTHQPESFVFFGGAVWNPKPDIEKAYQQCLQSNPRPSSVEQDMKQLIHIAKRIPQVKRRSLNRTAMGRLRKCPVFIVVPSIQQRDIEKAIRTNMFNLGARADRE